ncbi:DUF4232 domain-containing protein [Amycolatopsis magusensis]|uniref:DUF4232 domain-containing protein n=1 Tax=Amycolatopsis magusensis TaxID=882444 RepID=UPI003C30D688
MRNRRVALGTTAVAGVFALAACGSGTAAPQPHQPQAGGGGGAAPKLVGDESTPRCGTADLSVALGVPEQREEGSGQYEVPLAYTNTSGRTCGLHGVPGVDLVGPDDPMGTVYHLPRVDNGVPVNDVPAGKTATATITVLTPAPEAGPGWTPTHLVTIPPGQTEPLSVDWPSDLPVLRQDAATHPGTYVNGILADPL